MPVLRQGIGALALVSPVSRRDLDEFLGRADEVLAEPDPAPAACAWCAHPLDDASPSGDFCGERCASDWRAGLDRDPDERCACRACDPEWWADVADPALTAAARTLVDAALTTERGVFQRYYLGIDALHTWRTERLAADTHADLQDLSTDLPPAPPPPRVESWIEEALRLYYGDWLPREQ